MHRCRFVTPAHMQEFDDTIIEPTFDGLGAGGELDEYFTYSETPVAGCHQTNTTL